jgi:3',5'-cyclic AMP phosphodiesterase CpdA
MSTLKIVHLSDMHLLNEPQDTQRILLRSLMAALQQERQRGPVDLVAVTGDLFSTVVADARVEHEALQFFSALQRVLGEIPIVVIPGNHDRREHGVIGPHRADFFVRVKEFLAPLSSVKVLDFSTGPLSTLLPLEYGKSLMEIAALDSTRLLQGVFGAGGSIRPEDILLLDADLQQRQAVRDKTEALPLLLLMHHHIVPTPVTDRGRIQTGHTGSLKRAVVERLLPWLLANGDREEVMMTALGAGTALSTLQALGRAVIVLHGHKHYATMRLLIGPHDDDGDLLLAGAGSGGLAEPWQVTSLAEGAPIWPSFNVVSLANNILTVERVRFSPKETALTNREPMMSLAREGSRWSRLALAPNTTSCIELTENRAHFQVKPSLDSQRYDIECERFILPAQGAGIYDYQEMVEGPPGCFLLLDEKETARPSSKAPFELMIPYGRPMRYSLRNGVCRTITAAEKAYQRQGETYEWLALMNRYDAQTATLIVEGLGKNLRVFSSITDLGTGEERPQSLIRESGDKLILRVSSCRARTLLRIYWTLS